VQANLTELECGGNAPPEPSTPGSGVDSEFSDRTKLRVTLPPEPPIYGVGVSGRSTSGASVKVSRWPTLGGLVLRADEILCTPPFVVPGHAVSLLPSLLLDPHPSGILRGTYDGRPRWAA